MELYSGGSTVISIRRVAWALAHPEDCVGSDEEIDVTCGVIGNHENGDGCCINPAHLKKVTKRAEAA